MDRSWVLQLNKQFPVEQKNAFFDIAYENCGSTFLRESSLQYLDDKEKIYPGIVKAGGEGKGRTIDVCNSVREKLAAFLNAPSSKNIAFSQNTCQAMNLLLQGLSYGPNSNIVVADLEHVSVLMPCLQMQRRGIEVRVVQTDGLTVTAEQLLEYVDENTRVVAVSYVQSSSGYRIDLDALVDECHRRGVLVFTDAIQALGLLPVDVQALGVDALAASGYKSMLAGDGVGFFYISDACLPLLQPVFGGACPAVTLDREHMKLICTDVHNAAKMEAGTIPFQSIYGLAAGLDRIAEIGLDNISSHISDCFETIYNGLKQKGFQIAIPYDVDHRCNSLLVCTDNNEQMQLFFAERGVFFSCGKKGYVRISIAPFTTRVDIDRLFAVADEWIRLE